MTDENPFRPLLGSPMHAISRLAGTLRDLAHIDDWNELAPRLKLCAGELEDIREWVNRTNELTAAARSGDNRMVARLLGWEDTDAN